MKKFKLSNQTIEKFNKLYQQLLQMHSIEDLHLADSVEFSKGHCSCGGNCSGSCTGRCGGCGGSSCKGSFSIF